jgi:hypothetical protein
MAEVHEPIEAVQRPERVSSAAQQERITSASSYRSNAGAAATTEAVPVQERGGTLYADDVDLSRSATDDEKASVGHRTPGTVGIATLYDLFVDIRLCSER